MNLPETLTIFKLAVTLIFTSVVRSYVIDRFFRAGYPAYTACHVAGGGLHRECHQWLLSSHRQVHRHIDRITHFMGMDLRQRQLLTASKSQCCFLRTGRLRSYAHGLEWWHSKHEDENRLHQSVWSANGRLLVRCCDRMCAVVSELSGHRFSVFRVSQQLVLGLWRRRHKPIR